MSIQWTIVAGVMYAELAVTIFLLLPFISPQRWHSFFKSNFLKSIGNMSHIYFRLFLGVLVLLFMDAIREMRKYSNELDDNKHADHGHHLDIEMQAHMRLFRSQRNFYISGFSLFLWVVLQRLTSLISRLAVTMAEKEAALRQAKSASDAASQMLAGDKKKEKKDDDSATTELKELKEVNRKLQKENEASLKQAKSVSDEYDRLLKEHTALQEKFSKLSNEEGSKKSD